MKEMSHETSVTLKQLLNFGGKLKPKLLWELLHSLSFYLKSALKDPSSWEQGPVFLICSSKINFLQDGNVFIKQGSIGEYSDNLHVAPEFYSSETKLASPTTTEQIYVYCLGMTLYSAAEFNCEEEVELPPELEEVLIGMVNEVATLRTSFTLISQACQANIPMSKKSALKELIRSYFKNNAMEKVRRPLRSSKSLPAPPQSPLTPPSLPPPPPPSFHTLPSTTSIDTISSNSTSVSPGDKVDTALSKSHREEKQEEDEGNPYSTYEDLDVEIASTSSQAKPNGSSTRCKAVTPEKSDPNYSNAEELELENIRPTSGSSANSRCVSPQNLDNDCNTEDTNLEVRKSNPTLEISGNRPSLIREASVSSSEPDNPYGTSKARCRTGCVVGQCTHTQTDLDRMYTTVQKIRTPGKHESMKRSSSSGRVDGFRLDTSISATSSESSQPVQLTMRTTGKPVIIQFPSNKRFQISGQRDDTIKSVFTTVIKRLSIEDSSLFGLLHSSGKGFLEFVSPEHKLKMYAPDKWKSDAPTSPPVALKLGVKFYPPSPHKFVNQVTRLQFFLHIRNLILEERYQITKDTAFDLAALALQADMGDYYDRTGNQYFDPYSYVPPDVMSTLSYIYVSKEIPMLHSKLDDMSQNEAVLRYLQIVAKLPDYGVHFFQVNERNPYEVEHSTIGVALQAVILYEKPKDSTLKRGTAHRYTWNQIANLSYKNKTFILDVTVSSNGKKSKNERRYNFETESTKISRAIMTLCADTHKFYIKLKNMLPPEKGEEPTFSVRDYTPSPRSVITNNNGPEDADAGDAKSPKKTLGRSESDQSVSKHPSPNIQSLQKYVCLTKAESTQSLGLTIVGGDGSEGIYVDQLANGGLAHIDGRIRKGDMLLSVNGMSLKAMSHHDAVSLITRQPRRVELELIETSGEIPYHVTAEERGRFGSDSGESFEKDSPPTNKKQLDMNTSNSASATSNQGPCLGRSTKNALPSNGTQLPRNDISTLPESLQNRLAMQERYNLVRQPQPSTQPPAPRTHPTPGYNQYPSLQSPGRFRSASLATEGEEIIPANCNGTTDRAAPLKRNLTRGSSEQISPPNVEGSESGSFCSDYSPGQMVLNQSDSASIVKSEGGRSEVSNSSSHKVSLSRDPFSRIFTVYLTKQRGSLGMSIKVENGSTYVRDVFPNGPAAASGMVEKGDAVLSVNGVDLCGLSNQAVVNVLQQAPNNVTIVMSWGTGTVNSKSPESNRLGMQFRVTLSRSSSGFGFSTRNTYMGNESFIRIKTVHPGGPASLNGCLEEGDILMSVGEYSLENLSDRILSNVLSSVDCPAVFTVYRPDTIRTFNPRKFEVGKILPHSVLNSEDLSGFTLCSGYPYYRNKNEASDLQKNDRLLRVGSTCCQGIKSPQLHSIIQESSVLETQIFRPSKEQPRFNKQSHDGVDRKMGEMNIADTPTSIDKLMENAETIILYKKEAGLGFSLLGQHDGKRIVHGVTVKTVLDVGAAHEEGRLKPGDLIVMFNGRSMVGVTQSKALSTIRKSSGEVVLTVVPGHKRDLRDMTPTERRLVGFTEQTTDM
ncbi:hypothetical protein ACHWQZ_G007590 [Mnemiopsis leidyi]